MQLMRFCTKNVYEQYIKFESGYIYFRRGFMREFFVAFRSRADAVRFYEELASYHVSGKLINTPSSAKVGCGLSVKLFAKDMQQAKVVLQRGRYSSAIGFFYFGTSGNAIRL